MIILHSQRPILFEVLTLIFLFSLSLSLILSYYNV